MAERRLVKSDGTSWNGVVSASGGITQVSRANFPTLAAGTDGDIVQVTETGSLYLYDDTALMWVPDFVYGNVDTITNEFTGTEDMISTAGWTSGITGEGAVTLGANGYVVRGGDGTTSGRAGLATAKVLSTSTSPTHPYGRFVYFRVFIKFTANNVGTDMRKHVGVYINQNNSEGSRHSSGGNNLVLETAQNFSRTVDQKNKIVVIGEGLVYKCEEITPLDGFWMEGFCFYANMSASYETANRRFVNQIWTNFKTKMSEIGYTSLSNSQDHCLTFSNSQSNSTLKEFEIQYLKTVEGVSPVLTSTP